MSSWEEPIARSQTEPDPEMQPEHPETQPEHPEMQPEHPEMQPEHSETLPGGTEPASSSGLAQAVSPEPARSTLHPADDGGSSPAPSTRRAPMVIVRSGDAPAPEWAADAPAASERHLGETPRAAVASEPAASDPESNEPFPLARDVEAPSDRPSSAAFDGDWDAPGLDGAPAETREEPVPDALRQEATELREQSSWSPPTGLAVGPLQAEKRDGTEPRAADPTLARDGTEPRAREPSLARDGTELRPPVTVQFERPAPPRSKRWMFVAAAGLAVTAYFAVRTPSEPSAPVAREPIAEAPTESEPAAPEKAALAPAVREAGNETATSAPATAPKPAEPPAPPAEPKPAAKETTAKSARSSKPVPANATRVRLEVHPPDAKVGRRGVTQKPPYEFDVPKGKRIALEVLKKGYVTRKVTLDGKSPRVVVGLARAKSSRAR